MYKNSKTQNGMFAIFAQLPAQRSRRRYYIGFQYLFFLRVPANRDRKLAIASNSFQFLPIRYQTIWKDLKLFEPIASAGTGSPAI